MKRLLLIGMVLATLCLSLVAQTCVVRGVTYRVNGSEAEVVESAQKYHGDVFIPASVNLDGKEYLVTSIGARAFAGCKRLRSVSVVGNALRNVGAGAFMGCSFLECVSLPESVKTIGDDCFNMTNVQEFDCPSGLQELGKRAFYFSGLQAITLPSTLTEVKERTFAGCADLVKVEVPAGVKVAEDAYYNCPKLQK